MAFMLFLNDEITLRFCGFLTPTRSLRAHLCLTNVSSGKAHVVQGHDELDICGLELEVVCEPHVILCKDSIPWKS